MQENEIGLSGGSSTINKLQHNKILAEALRGMERAITVKGAGTMMSMAGLVLNPLGSPQASSSPSSSNFKFKQAALFLFSLFF